MNTEGFELDAAPARRDETVGGPNDADARVERRAAPQSEDGDHRAEEPAEEPGYGHGV